MHNYIQKILNKGYNRIVIINKEVIGLFVAHTRDTMSDIYLDALRIRQEVFIKEQEVPESREIDEDEAHAIHFVLYKDEQSKQPMATLRLLPSDNEKIKLQRMAVLKDFRKQGLGRVIMEAAEAFAKEQNYKKLYLGAQLTALPFYQSLAYETEGEEFLDADMPHIQAFKLL